MSNRQIRDNLPTSKWTSWSFTFGAPLFILCTPFVKFIANRDYGFLHLEVFYVFGFISLIALIIALLISLRPKTLKPLMLGLLILVSFSGEIQQYSAPFIQFLTQLLSAEALANSIVFVFLLFSSLSITWILSRHLEAIILVSFGVIMMSTLLLPLSPYPQWQKAQFDEHNQDAAPNPNRPPILHLILDQQIGINGIPTDIDGGKQLQNDLRDFYRRYGFTSFPRAYTHFPATLESISNMLNRTVKPDAWKYVRTDGRVKYILKNEWFRRLGELKYKIDVKQSRYFNFCGTKNTPVTAVRTCSTYDQSDIRYFHHMDISSYEKAMILIEYLFEVDFKTILKLPLYLYQELQIAAAGSGIELPNFAVASISPSPFATLATMKQLENEVGELKPGRAIFAHLLLPHDPYVLNSQCKSVNNLKYSAPRGILSTTSKTTRSKDWRILAYKLYFQQVRCTHLRLGRIFDRMKTQGNFYKSIIIVHGDHGSHLSLSRAIEIYKSEISKRDIIDSYSTLFAVKMNGLPAGENSEQVSIQNLFARLFMNVPSLENQRLEKHGNVYLRPNKGIVGPDQLAVPMPLIPFNRPRN